MSVHKVLLNYRVGSASFLISFILAFFSIETSAQIVYPVLTNVDSAGVWFDRTVNSNSASIVNGPAYFIPFKGLKTHPFYQSVESDRSFVLYDNDRYENLDLLYDTYSDILVLKYVTSTGTHFINLDENQVQEFDLHHHHFKKFDDGIKTKIGTYFDVLFEKGDFAVLAKRSKVERIEARRRDYLEEDVFYIVTKERWIRITGRGSFYKTLRKDQRKQLNSFIRSNHINLRKRMDEDLKKIGSFCYSLNESKR